MQEKRLESSSAAKTLAIGKKLAQRLKTQDIVCLFGELGSGKTVFTKGIAQGMGIRKEEVISPTFVLMRAHLAGRLPLYHFDLYRLKSARELFALDYEEYFFGDGVTVVEWADRLGFLLPKEYLGVQLGFGKGTRRHLRLFARGRRYASLLEDVSEDTGR